MPAYYESLCTMEQFVDSPQVTLRVAESASLHAPRRRNKQAGARKSTARAPAFPNLIRGIPESELGQDHARRMRKSKALYRTARPVARKQPGPKADQAAKRLPSPHMASTDGGLFTPAARREAHAISTQPHDRDVRRRQMAGARIVDSSSALSSGQLESDSMGRMSVSMETHAQSNTHASMAVSGASGSFQAAGWGSSQRPFTAPERPTAGTDLWKGSPHSPARSTWTSQQGPSTPTTERAVDQALLDQGRFAGGVGREPSERTEPNAAAFDLRIRDIQSRIEARLLRYSSAAARPSSASSVSKVGLHGEAAAAQARGRLRGSQAFLQRNPRLAALHEPGAGGDPSSGSPGSALDKSTLRLQEALGSQLARTASVDTQQLPAPATHPRSAPATPGGGGLPASPFSVGALKLGHGGGAPVADSSPAAFMVKGLPRTSLPPIRPQSAAGRMTVSVGTLAHPTQPARTPTSATAFPGRVVHQRSMRIAGQSTTPGSGRDAFRVAMLTLAADMSSGDMTLSLFDPSTAKIHKQTYAAAELKRIMPVPASFHSASHVLKYKWWEHRLHTMADQVEVEVDDASGSVTMHLQVPASVAEAQASSGDDTDQQQNLEDHHSIDHIPIAEAQEVTGGGIPVDA